MQHGTGGDEIPVTKRGSMAIIELSVTIFSDIEGARLFLDCAATIVPLNS
jgi:hypothetical protein